MGVRRHRQTSASLRNDGVVVVRMSPHAETRHIYNGMVVADERTQRDLHECNWDPFAQLELADDFFHTYISATSAAYMIVVRLPDYIARSIRVQRAERLLAVVGKAVARRQWTDASRPAPNVHEVWRVYHRLFRIPVQCDIARVRALYGESSLTVVVPRRDSWRFRLAHWAESHVWHQRRLAERAAALQADT
ncbi:hypothetical protein H4R18_000245 [Coemansia javaensis]|uniref:Uncharacterized protein n=1 Tax=Coemansia javaensis TaxID=2761396 RepID=A0A9W8HIL5_9FUNG|nr:hypothetical protein H4R18_000245 [Coemansia javaensis]